MPAPKHIEITEEQLKNLDVVAAVLFSDENDPRSYSYKRQLNRPTIPWWRMIAWLVLALADTAGLYFLLTALDVASGTACWICAGTLVLISAVHLKQILIGLIRIYQRYAPASLRNKCRFEPSCSEYMVLSLQKYGLFRGLAKGCNRLSRCNVSGGGFDDP